MGYALLRRLTWRSIALIACEHVVIVLAVLLSRIKRGHGKA